MADVAMGPSLPFLPLPLSPRRRRWRWTSWWLLSAGVAFAAVAICSADLARADGGDGGDDDGDGESGDGGDTTFEEVELKDFREMICLRHCMGNNTDCMDCCHGCCWDSTDCTRFKYSSKGGECTTKQDDDENDEGGDDGDDGEFVGCLSDSECLMTCYGDLTCETCCLDCCQRENSECVSFTYDRKNETHPCLMVGADGSEDAIKAEAVEAKSRAFGGAGGRSLSAGAGGAVITKTCTTKSRNLLLSESIMQMRAGSGFSGMGSGASGFGRLTSRLLFDPEDIDNVAAGSGNGELEELLRSFDRDRSAGVSEEERMLNPDTRHRVGARRREGSFWLKWLGLYGDEEETREEEEALEEAEQWAEESGRKGRKEDGGFSDAACPEDRHLLLDPGSTVFITSPGFPDSYPANVRCSWKFESAEEGGVVEIKINKMDLQHHLSCAQKDYLRISHLSRDSSDTGEEVLCGREGLGRTLASSPGAAAEVEFVSDGEQERSGFNLMITAR